MYGWLWRTLPGGTMAKVVAAAFIVVAVAAVLWFVAFPWAATHLPIDGSSIGR